MKTQNNKTKTATTIITALVIGLILASSSTMSSVSGQVSQNTVQSSKPDSKYYSEQFKEIQGKILSLRQEKKELETQINSLKEKSGNGTTIQISNLQQQLESINNKIVVSSNQLDQIQDKSRALFMVDSQTKSKFYHAEKVLLDRFLNKDSANYVGTNPVVLLFADLEHKDIVVYLNPNQTLNAANGAKVTADLVNEMESLDNGIPIDVHYGTIQNLSCNGRTSVCSPQESGISITQQGQSSSQASTEGYYDTDFLGNVGFLIAGHAAGFIGQTIVQPGGSSDAVGTVEKYCLDGSGNRACDFAFVTANSGISVSDSIFQAPNTVEPITSRTTGTNQQVGTTVTYSGLGSGIVSGAITSNSPNFPYLLVRASSASGDSGSSVYVDQGTQANLYGMLFAKTTDSQYYLYYAQDYIAGQLGIN